MPSSENETAIASEAPTWQKSTLRDYFESICIAVIFALFVRTFVVQAFKIPSSSMEENLLVGDHILVNKFAYAPHAPWMEKILPYHPVERKDVFVFKYPKDPVRDFIKRVIGVGGDRIEVRLGSLIRNEERVEEPYAVFKSDFGRRENDNHEEVRVPSDHYFAMGDNRLNSEDSRFWGFVPQSHVKGEALLIYWSFELPRELKQIEVLSAPTAAQKGAVLRYTIAHFLTKTRWRRTFKIVR